MMKRSLIGLRARQRPRPTSLRRSLLMLSLLLAFDAVPFTNAFIVPEELPSILSLVYSNIPQIKKGTDSRVGFGFRLGEHADFQIQLELGPQLNTKPIGAAAGSSKRYVDNEEYANSVRNPTRNGGSTSWLQAWSKQTKQRQQFNKDKLRDSLMPPAPVMDEGAYNQLQQLYEMNKQREYEDSIGTLPAEVLETRINQLKALHSPVTPFKPMPSEPRSGVAGTSEEKQSPSESMIIVVTPEVQVESTTTTAPTAESTTVVSERIKVRESTGGPTVDSGRRNVRRRTNRPVSKWDKERITAQLSDVSLD
ncbi:uncharacterized protein LOC118510543 [Anopheles stephensi]|uniref:uncharacterized protein LOC118510543 n=1 Tax=Anopheles stephensi TaxID=30069 RepID=UPI001658761F|nr:uncharacterized protein LOC118510543 [Anopheles stephensi]XP_035908401.1 uncharacterized protein LOC118510543 [Anopheles stephensi]XP_035908402.1 uncharacterized protein LOC118510543 [Anopheles stephensi]XP_035908403.1 uncharacterized protein LOC118510543 [Anopheles stephensi]XP_035908404.1 uncharacterized protein LOC118510543 [Anopheles stephensi]XP_035908405.1 uncharacterized protein LOC118510543 [Anopheles stephensi]